MSLQSLLHKEPGRTDWSRDSDLGKRSAKGAVVIASGSWLRFGLQFMSTIILARILGPEEYGVGAVILAVGAASSLIRESGFFTLAAQRIRLGSRLATSLHSASIALGLVFTLLMLMSGPLMAGIFDDQRYVIFAALLCPTFALAGLTAVPGAVLTRNLFSERLASLEIAASAVSVVVGIVIAAAGWGAYAMVAQTLALSFAQAILTLILCPWTPAKGVSWRYIKTSLPAVSSLTAVQTLNYLTANFDKVLVGALFGLRAAGYYSQAIQLLQIPLHLIGSPLQKVFIPALSRVKRQRDRFLKYLRSILLVMTGTLWPFFGILVLHSEAIIILLFGEAWSPAAPLFVVLAICGYAQAVGFVVAWVMVSRGRFRTQLKLSVVSRVIILSAYLIGSLWGEMGVAVGVSISTTVLFIPGYVLIARDLKVGWRFLGSAVLWPSVICATGIYVSSILDWIFPSELSAYYLFLQLVCVGVLSIFVAVAIRPVRLEIFELSRLLRPVSQVRTT